MSKRNRIFLAIVSSLMLVTIVSGLWARLGPLAPQVSRALSVNTQRPEMEDPMASHPDEARKFRTLSLMDENGYIPPDGLDKAAEHMDVMRASQAADSMSITSGGWTWIGPGNIGGRVRSIIIHPATPTIMWAGSVTGGIWKTTNGGTTWQILTDFMSNMAVTAMVIDPANPNILYAGTGEGFTGNREVSEPLGGGIFKTTDGGTTWTKLASTNTADFYFVNRLAISPANSQILLAATTTGIWRSADGGASWTQTFNDFSADVNFNPNDGTKAVAGNLYSGAAYYSVNSGVSWNTVQIADQQLPAGGGGGGRVEVAYAPSNPSIVYASVDNNGGQLWKSTNGGQSYSLVNNGNNFLATQGWYDNALWVDPTNPNTLIVGGVDLYRSANGGTNLTQISEWWNAPFSAHADHHIIVEKPGFNGTSNKTVYFGNDGGVYRADNVYTVIGSAGWTELNNNLGITQFYGASGNPTTGKIIGGTQDNGTLVYTPAGGSEGWTTTFGGDGGWSAADPVNAIYLYGEYVYAQVHRSNNGGTFSDYIWGASFDGVSSDYKPAPYIITDARDGKANFIAPVILDPNEPNRLLVGGFSLWRTNNARAVNTSVTGPAWYVIKPPSGDFNSISAIVVAPGNSNIIWAGHNNGDVYKTVNGTAAAPTWTRVDTGTPNLPNRYVTRITIDKNNTNRVFVTFGGFSADNIWVTMNGGSTWTDSTGTGVTGLPNLPVRTLVLHPDDSNWVYAGTELGLFASEDGGTTWGLPHDGPTNTPVDELFWMGTKLVAATYGRGLFTQEAYTGIFADVPSSYWAVDWIERLYNAGITGGCASSPLRYCPEASVTRAQMAIFILRGIHGSAYTPPAATGTVFTDVPASYWAAAWIERLSAEGITSGCSGTSYCPEANVTRAQMAIFLLRGKYGSAYVPPAATGTVFTDVPASYWAAAWIERLFAEGITSGCGGTSYCPDANVTRAQMAAFLVKTFNLP